MKSSIVQETGLQRKLEFIIPADEVNNCFSANYQKLQKKAELPGFRQGKVPLSTLKQKYASHARKGVMDDLFQAFYPKALEKENIDPAGPPSLVDLDLKEGQDCRFLMELEVHPQVKVEHYKNLELKKQDVGVKEEDVTGALEKLRQSYAVFEDSKELAPLKKGDFCTINLEGFSGSERKLNYPNLLLQIGEDTVGAGFDQNLMGLQLNEEKKFDFVFPKNHPHLEVAGLNLLIKVKLTGFKNKKVPELNDDLAKKFKLESLKELKERIKKDLESNLQQKAKEEMENAVVEQLVKKNPVELPESLVRDQKQKLQANARKRLEEYKLPKAEQENFIQEKSAEFEKEARQSLHASYLMEQLIKDLQIKTTDEDIQKSMQESFPSKKPEEMEKKLKEGGYWNHFIFNLTRQKVISYLIDKARITKSG